MVIHREIEDLRHVHRRSPDREHGAAFLEELLDLRGCLRRCICPELALILRRDICRSTATTPATPPPAPPPRPPRPPAGAGPTPDGKMITSNLLDRFPASIAWGKTTSKSKPYCSRIHLVQPDGIDPPYWSASAMRIFLSLIASPAGRAATPSKLTPSSVASCATAAAVEAFVATKNVPCCGPDDIQETSSPALTRRLMATNESLTAWLNVYPAVAVVVTFPGAGFCKPFSFSKGPSNPSRIRSTLTPI